MAVLVALPVVAPVPHAVPSEAVHTRDCRIYALHLPAVQMYCMALPWLPLMAASSSLVA